MASKKGLSGLPKGYIRSVAECLIELWKFSWKSFRISTGHICTEKITILSRIQLTQLWSCFALQFQWRNLHNVIHTSKCNFCNDWFLTSWKSFSTSVCHALAHAQF